MTAPLLVGVWRGWQAESRVGLIRITDGSPDLPDAPNDGDPVVVLAGRWCPDCNGEGAVTHMSGGPDLDETTFPCSPCGGSGIVISQEHQS